MILYVKFLIFQRCSNLPRSTIFKLEFLPFGYISKFTSGPNGMALSFRDIAAEWNNIIGNSLDIPINVSDIPADWGIDDVSFYIAPESGTFNQINYQQGFWIYGGFDIFGIDCDVDIKVTSNDF